MSPEFGNSKGKSRRLYFYFKFIKTKGKLIGKA